MSDGFLSRWSRLKEQSRQTEPAPLEPTPPEPEATATPETTAEPPPPPELPSIESLTTDSDFSPFLQAGVPEEIRKAAMARLWASDPLFSQPEVYDLHMEDYGFPSTPEVVKTAWKFGKGIVEELHENSTEAKGGEPQQVATENNPEEDSHS